MLLSLNCQTFVCLIRKIQCIGTMLSTNSKNFNLLSFLSALTDGKELEI